jgi:hypothetical protein
MYRLILFLAMLMSGGLLIIDRKIIFVVIVLLFVITNISSRFNLKAMLATIAWISFVFLFYFLAHGFSSELFLNRISLVIVGLTLVFSYRNKNESVFKDDFSLLGVFFAVQVILTSLLANSLPSLFTLIVGEKYQLFTLLGIFNYHELIASVNFKRPDGFFYEPGALYYSIILRRHLGMIIVLVVSVVLTASTTGLIILSAILLRFMYARILEKLTASNIVVSMVLFIGLIGFFPIFLDNIQEKFIGVSSGSWLARQHDTVVGIQLVMQHPWFGIGVDVDKYVSISYGAYGSFLDFSSNSHFVDRQPTNSVIQMFYGFGIPLGLLWLYMIYNSRYINRSLTHMIIIVLTLSTELLALTPIFLFFVMSQARRQKYV